MVGVGIGEGLARQRGAGCAGAGGSKGGVTFQHRARHLQRAGQSHHAVATLLLLAFLVLAVVMQRHWAANGMIGTKARVAVLNAEVLVKQTLLQQHRLVGEVLVHLVQHARHTASVGQGRSGRVERA